MKGFKHTSNRKPPGRLPLFPEPYPGESFYSILCRYHVRSGNINDWYTSNQLFGYNSSLTSTLLTPFHLELVNHWLSPSSGIDSEKLLHSNTAFNLYAITAISRELERIRDVVNGNKPTASFPRWMHPRIIHPSGISGFARSVQPLRESSMGNHTGRCSLRSRKWSTVPGTRPGYGTATYS